MTDGCAGPADAAAMCANTVWRVAVQQYVRFERIPFGEHCKCECRYRPRDYANSLSSQPLSITTCGTYGNGTTTKRPLRGGAS